MELKYKPDWEIVKKRLNALWDREILDRCCVAVTAPMDKDKPYIENVPTDPDGLKAYYLDVEWILQRNIERMEKTYFGGDAFPCIFPYFGTGGHAKYLSPEVIYRPDTIWIPAVMEEYEGFDFSFDPETNKIFKKEREIICTLAKEGMGKFFVSPPDNCGSLDALSQLRGNSNLLMDFYDQPDELKNALEKLINIWKESSSIIFHDIYENNDQGCIHGWMNTWSDGSHMQLQCDESVMFSSDTYKEFEIPELEECSAFMQHAIYHMDGMEQLRHMEMITDVPNINMIQWIQVAGQPSISNFWEQLRRMQKKQKGLVLQIKKNQLKDVLQELSPRGVILIVEGAESKEEADAIVNYVNKYHFSKEQLY